MKRKWIHIVFLLTAVLFCGNLFSQDFTMYQWELQDYWHHGYTDVTQFTPPNTYVHGYDIRDTVFFSPDWEYDPRVANDWTTAQCKQALRNLGYYIKVKNVNAIGNQIISSWPIEIQCHASVDSECYGCDDYTISYTWLFEVINANENWPALPPTFIEQTVYVINNPRIPDDAFTYFEEEYCDPGMDLATAWSQFPITEEDIKQYVSAHGGYVPQEGHEGWEFYDAGVSFEEVEQVRTAGACERVFDVRFTFANHGYIGEYSYHQLIHMPAPSNFQVLKTELDTLVELDNSDYDIEDRMIFSSASEFTLYGAVFANLMFNDKLSVKNVETMEQPNHSNPFDSTVYYQRMYYLIDSCSNQTAELSQIIIFKPEMRAIEKDLKRIHYEKEDQLPEPYQSLDSLMKYGLHVRSNFGYFDEESYSMSVVKTEQVAEDARHKPIFKRWYLVQSTHYEWVQDTAYQIIRQREQRLSDPWPMKVDVTDINCDNGSKGSVKITDANTDMGCPECLDQQQWYVMEYVNHSRDDETFVVAAHSGSDTDIWEADQLKSGDYTLNVYVTCSHYPDATEPIWKHDFTIKEDEEYGNNTVAVRAVNNAWMSGVNVTGNSGSQAEFFNYTTLVAWVHSVCGYNEDPDAEWADKRDQPWAPEGSKRISYTWKGTGAVKGYPKNRYSFIGMTKEEYEDEHSFTQYYHWSKEFLEIMSHRLFDGRTWQFNLEKGRNDMRVIVDYIDGEETVTEHADFTVYFQCISKSHDPNELYGPEGYDTVVHYINATDPITYTIMFENDPEFATAAASRVKITCPLNDKGVVNTFRLGTFGFGDYTFEVPDMASQYSQRLDLVDSLGVWLDVTAGVQIPENYAYWIFQSVDPATGLPPVGSLGFLPVNDTLNPGNGEGYVTFAINPVNGLASGDEISEQAHIVFDQNDTVPTNTYTNRFDALAPVSSLQVDTTAADSGILGISFNAIDDPDGSGVDFINLYVSIDNANYELIGRVDPDSVYRYQMDLGTQFQFIGCAVDHVNNKEEFKTDSEFTFIRGTAPTDLRLTVSTFNEDASLSTAIGNFITVDDQTSNMFIYTLVNGEGADHNGLFDIVGNTLVTNNDFRCYGLYDYSIRVRSLDLSHQYIEKVFNIHAVRNMTPEVTIVRDYVCPNQPYFFGGEWLNESGFYYDTLQTTFGCDSIVCLALDDAATPLLDEVADEICFGYDYDGNGFNLSADTLLQLTQGWTMQNDVVLSIDRYNENFYGCYDTTRLALTVHPSFNYEDAVAICPTDLPYQYQGVPLYHDTVAVFSYQTGLGCDSIYTLNLSVKQIHDQNNDFANGWNWFSTFVDQSNGEGLTKLEDALNGNGQMIKSKTAFVSYDPDYNMWFGNLEEINNTSMFMVKMRDPQATLLTGCPADIDTIMLAAGWTWIGYPLTDTTGVNQLTPAIGGAPANDDVVKSKQSFAMYNAEYGIWFGSLDDMIPGIGYMYLSNADNEKPLYYGNRQRKSDIQPLDIPLVHWNANDKPFASNMTIMGLISLDGQDILSDTLEVGAFVNNEQRGSGRAVYIEQMDAYRIFLTVHGEDGETVDFRLFNHSRDKERRIRCDEQLTFMADRHFGTLDKPYVFAFETFYDQYIQAEICEGEYYTENNFRVFESGTYFKELVTAQGNDSVVRLDLTVNPVYHVAEEVVAVEFPFEYEGVMFDKPGTFVLPFQTAVACDSVWEVTVTPYEGLRELLISPLPASKTQRISLYYPFTQTEQRGVVVEVYTVGGSLLQSKRPTRFPIELDPFPTSGTYMVKITMGTGEVLSGKIIIR